MKQKVVISVASQVFEFEGEILELTSDYIVLKAKHGDVYIERKHLVFIQFLEEEEPEQVEKKQLKPRTDGVAKFVSKRLKHDPVNEIMEKFVPPSQFPDDEYTDESDDNDTEALKNVGHAVYGENPLAKVGNLQDAVKAAMQNENVDFSMGMGGGKYQSPAQTILGMKNASNKKSGNS